MGFCVSRERWGRVFLPLPSIDTGAAKTATGVMARRKAERRRIGVCIVVCVAELFGVVDWVVGG